MIGVVVAWLLVPTYEAEALEKYGRQLPALGEVDHRGAEESLLADYLLTGIFASNPSFAARPDNTGLVGLRHMLHLETDLYKQYLTFYTDQNFFSDRTNGWTELSEWDGTYAFTGVLGHLNWRLQYERDAPIDRNGIHQAYSQQPRDRQIPSGSGSSWMAPEVPESKSHRLCGSRVVLS